MKRVMMVLAVLAIISTGCTDYPDGAKQKVSHSVTIGL